MLERKEYLDSLPKKFVSAGGLILNEKQEILIVKPTYRDWWLLPGGASDVLETPEETCIREVEEETSLKLKAERLLTVTYFQRQDNILKKKLEYVNFVFYMGTLNPAQQKEIVIPEKELSEYRFVDEATATELVGIGNLAMPFFLKALREDKVLYKDFKIP